ncbi:MAG: hypothetical protein ABIR46_00045, partial [Candidatus Saccharimonadales bacterium]
MEKATFITKRRIVIAVIFGFLATVLMIILFTPLYQSFFTHKTPYRSNMIPTLQGDYIYAYSGTAFYKTN